MDNFESKFGAKTMKCFYEMLAKAWKIFYYYLPQTNPWSFPWFSLEAFLSLHYFLMQLLRAPMNNKLWFESSPWSLRYFFFLNGSWVRCWLKRSSVWIDLLENTSLRLMQHISSYGEAWKAFHQLHNPIIQAWLFIWLAVPFFRDPEADVD